MPGRIARPTVVFGTASFGSPVDPQAKFNNVESANALLEALRSHGYNHVDTARAYPVGASGTSEALLGAIDVGSWATVDSKVTSWIPGAHGEEGIKKSIARSLDALKMSKVNIMYLHAPDRSTPFEITCRAMDAAWRAGKFDKFGISNYTAREVKELVEICEREGLVRPRVYQGQYNAILRGGEQELFPVLRKFGIAFYAYRYVGCEGVELQKGTRL